MLFRSPRLPRPLPPQQVVHQSAGECATSAAAQAAAATTGDAGDADAVYGVRAGVEGGQRTDLCFGFTWSFPTPHIFTLPYTPLRYSCTVTNVESKEDPKTSSSRRRTEFACLRLAKLASIRSKPVFAGSASKTYVASESSLRARSSRPLKGEQNRPHREKGVARLLALKVRPFVSQLSVLSFSA